MRWRGATVTALLDETPTARTLVLLVEGWPGHRPGQHLDVRLTAKDGYTATRSYSIASALSGTSVSITVERMPDGEVSPYLTHEASIGDRFEVLGPLGGWFVWNAADPAPVQLVAGGSGVVPLMSMIRTHSTLAAARPGVRLLYSVRDRTSVLYAAELARRGREQPGLAVAYRYTRRTPPGWPVPPARLTPAVLAQLVWEPGERPMCFVCGPSAFVEVVATALEAQGHDSGRIRTERFGPGAP